jgi:hypothetical protein
MIRLVSGSNLELPKNCEIGTQISPATMNLLRRFARGAPGGAQGAVAPPGPDGFGPDVRRPPNGYVDRCSSEVQSAPSMDDALSAAIGAARLITPAANSWRTPPLRPRAWPHSRVSASGLRDSQKSASTSTASPRATPQRGRCGRLRIRVIGASRVPPAASVIRTRATSIERSPATARCRKAGPTSSHLVVRERRQHITRPNANLVRILAEEVQKTVGEH